MQGTVLSKHHSLVRYRERDMENEQHTGDGMYVKNFETTKDRCQRLESEYKDRHLNRDLFNEKDEPGKKFTDFVRKRDKLQEIHKHGRVKYHQYTSETDRVTRSINKSPFSLEPLQSQILFEPGYQSTNKSKWVSKNDFQSLKGMQSWEIWRDLSGEREIPLSQSIEGSEPFLKKIVKIERDPRRFELEKDKEFNAYSKNDIRKDQTLLQTISLRSLQSMQCLLNVTTLKTIQESTDQNTLNLTKDSFYQLGNSQEYSNLQENLLSPKITQQNWQQQSTPQNQESLKPKPQNPLGKSLKNLKDTIDNQKILILSQKDLKQPDLIREILKLKSQKNSAQIFVRQDSSKLISQNAKYQNTIEELNDSHIVQSLMENKSQMSKNYFKSAQVLINKQPFKTKDMRDKDKLEIQKQYFSRNGDNSPIAINGSVRYSSLRNSNQYDASQREKNVKSAMESIIINPVKPRFNRRQSITRNDNSNIQSKSNFEAVKIQDQGSPSPRNQNNNSSLDRSLRDELLDQLGFSQKFQKQSKVSGRNSEFGLIKPKFKTISLPSQFNEKSNPYLDSIVTSTTASKQSNHQQLPSLNLNKQNIKHIVKAYFKNQPFSNINNQSRQNSIAQEQNESTINLKFSRLNTDI
eukprot:403340029